MAASASSASPRRPRAALLLLLAVVVLCVSCLMSTCDAQRILKAHHDDEGDANGIVPSRVLREAAVSSTSSSDGTEATVEAASNATSTATTAESESSSTTSTAASEAHTETHAEGPSLSSFTGPMIAGAVAILLIGFVIAFKNRDSH